MGAQATWGLSDLRIHSTKLVQIGFVVCLDSHQVEGGLCHFLYHLILDFFWLECGPWGHCPFPFPPLPSAEVQASLKGLGLHLGRRERGEGEGAMMLVLHRMLHSGTGGTLGPTVGLHSTLLVHMALGPWGPWPTPWMGLQPLGALRLENPQYHFSTEGLCQGGGLGN